ncbi:hypothetical protein [Streptomyces gibsoniae]|uniref:Uncharacterized protein n=1 Tax=Streptomyces gibsoniae TaxID=3075529 RepID=A0ABU2TQ89_9ACTN|nr:hypothetical protein [Streptomyces sp. DSM 41699]MDT0463006.1 hypothetical protein [Streptomyces sp. DSM 41699]
MDPLTAMTAGKAAAGRRFAFYVAVQLTSVVVPGLVAVTCLTVLMLHAQHPGSIGRTLKGAAQALHGPAVIMVDVSWLASAYVVGYVGREVAFRLLGLAERLSPRHRATLGALHGELEVAYGHAALRRCLRTHPLLKYLLSPADGTSPHSRIMRQPGGALRTGNAYEAFNYAKSWLREHNPGLAPDATEAEINILVSTPLPLALGTWSLIALTPLSIAASAVAVVIAAAVSALTFVQVLRLRRVECWEALRNLLEDHEMRLAAARLPGSPFPAEPGEDTQDSGAA